jgi:hypothetical protein
MGAIAYNVNRAGQRAGREAGLAKTQSKTRAPALDAGLAALFAAQRGVITATQLAEWLEVQPRTVQKRAKELEAVRAGRVYLLTPAQAAQIQADLQAPGKRGPKPRAQSE